MKFVTKEQFDLMAPERDDIRRRLEDKKMKRARLEDAETLSDTLRRRWKSVNADIWRLQSRLNEWPILRWD